ncbi:hypothetical protein HY629_01025 [Candidatus Uhrbacteria bacterium]|nr:hypothetical protein [Candidatus Uhrbacteria bacterium]
MAFVSLFSFHVVHDWQRALLLPRTLDNAVDCALAVYLDAVNVSLTAIRTLRMMSRKPAVKTLSK